MKFILFLLLVLLPIAFSIDQISDDQTQAAATSDSQDSTSAENPETSQVEAKDAEDNTQTPSPQADTASQEETKSSETAPQTTAQETQKVAEPSTENKEKSTTSATKTPKTSTKTQQDSQVYVSKDDDSSCKGLCLSGGVCKNDVCICPPGFSGERCELVFDANESKYQAKMDAVVTKYYYSLIGFVGLVAVMVLSECCCKGGSGEGAPKEDIPIGQDQDQKYVDLDLEAGHHGQDKNYADADADVEPVQEGQPEAVVHVEEEGQNYVEPEVVPVEEEQQNYVEPEVVHVEEEEQNYVEPEVVHVEEEQQNYVEPEVIQVEEEQNYVEPEVIAQEE